MCYYLYNRIMMNWSDEVMGDWGIGGMGKLVGELRCLGVLRLTILTLPHSYNYTLTYPSRIHPTTDSPTLTLTHPYTYTLTYPIPHPPNHTFPHSHTPIPTHPHTRSSKIRKISKKLIIFGRCFTYVKYYVIWGV